MGRRKSLAEELAELATSAPTREEDPEDDLLGAGAALEETEDELQAPPSKSRKVAEGQRLRAALDLDGEEYAGRATSRRAAFGDSNGWHEEGEALTDDEEEAAEDGEAGGADELVGSPAPSTHADDEPAQPSTGIDGGEDEEMAVLEAEFEAVAAADAAAVGALRERAARERARGVALRNQRAVWEAVLEQRILLQRCLQAANRLPYAECHAAAAAATPELRSGFAGLADACGATLGSLLELQAALVRQHPAASAAAAAVEAARGSGADAWSANGAIDSGALWARLEAARAAVAPFRDAALDRWHRKALLAAGGGVQRGGLKALDQAVSAQVAALLRDPVRARARSQLPRAQAPRPLCQPADLAPGEVPGDAGAGNEADAPAEERVAETYDDSEFYQQLLKEFLEGSAAAGARVQSLSQGGKKRRKQVDRRASKGRKLRYHVHEKLVNFVAPRPPAAEPAFATQLFANLFGRPAG
ncbi:hypothetical protein WJX81_001171 [Elliptochloris bilobata]|uniref:Apoptosis antagonizing transcription factor n=1 Tax=Elliptochloris bilobata TaxID=381761 RepID=A0AAW1S7N8_9CHLO